MIASEFPLYFKIADDFLSCDYTLAKYCNIGLEQYCEKHNLDILQLGSKNILKHLFRFINKRSPNKLHVLNNLAKWESIYDDYQLSGLSKTRYYKFNKETIGIGSSGYFDLLTSIEFKRAYDTYRGQTQYSDQIELDSSAGASSINIADIPENNIDLGDTAPTPTAQRVAPVSFCNTSIIGAEIRVSSNGHCISFNSTTPERSVALLLNALSSLSR